MEELIIPPLAQEDPEAFEILRVWAANGEQHVTIHSYLNGDSKSFGQMLADLALHGANLYAERLNIPAKESLKNLLDGFNKGIDDESVDISGEIMK